MNRILHLGVFIALLFCLSLTVLGQAAQLPSVQIKTMDGKTIGLKEVANKDEITVIIFWASWDNPSKKVLDNLKDLYPEWKGKYKVNIIAINMDYATSFAKAIEMIQVKGWDYTFYYDSGQICQNQLHFNTTPYWLLVDQKGEVVSSHTGYASGDEEELEEQIKALSKK